MDELVQAEKRLGGGTFDKKALDDGSYEIAGYASVFDVKDSEGETMQSGAFAQDLAAYMSNPVVLFDHGDDPEIANKPVGNVLTAKTDTTGLFVTAKVYPSVLPSLQSIFERVRDGVLRAFSVGGFKYVAAGSIKRFDLREISLVAMPANQLALRTKSLGGDMADQTEQPAPQPPAVPAVKKGAVLSGANLTDVTSIKDLANGVLQRHQQGGGNAADDGDDTDMEDNKSEKATAPTATNTPTSTPPAPQPAAVPDDVMEEAKKRLAVKEQEAVAKEAAILAAMNTLEDERTRASKAAQITAQQPAAPYNYGGFPAVNYGRPRPAFDFGEALIATLRGEDYKYEGKSLREVSKKAMSQGTLSDVGYFVPQEWMDSIIPFLRFKGITEALGITEVPWGDGYSQIHWPKQTGSTTAAMVGEGATISTSDLAAGEVVFTEHYATGGALASRQLMANAPALNALIKNDLTTSVKLLFDQQVFEGSGSAGQIAGIAGTAGIMTTGAGANAVNGAVASFDDIFNILALIENNGAQVDVLVMHPTRWNGFRKIKDTTGNYVLNLNQGYNVPNPVPDAIDEKKAIAPVGMLCGKPVFTTNQISTTLTVGSSSLTSNIYALDDESMAYGIKGGIVIEASTEAGSNTFMNHQLLIKAIMTCDAHVLRTQGVGVLTGCLLSSDNPFSLPRLVGVGVASAGWGNHRSRPVPIEDSYCADTDVATYLRSTVSSADTALIDLIIPPISRMIDEYCNQSFGLDDADTTRTYYTQGLICPLNPLLNSLTSVTLDSSVMTDGSYYLDTAGATPTGVTPPFSMLRLYPYNYSLNFMRAYPFPYYSYVLANGSVYEGHKVDVVGRFGWPAVPTVVKYAAIVLTVREYKAADAGFSDVIGVTPSGQPVYTKAMPQNIQRMLDKYKLVRL